MVTVLGESTVEEKVILCVSSGEKSSMQRVFMRKFPVYVGKICRVKRFHLGGKRFADDEEVEMEMRKWLRQLPQEFCAAGFNALVKRWDKCINVGGGYVEK
jgi:hypothetical protein